MIYVSWYIHASTKEDLNRKIYAYTFCKWMLPSKEKNHYHQHGSLDEWSALWEHDSGEKVWGAGLWFLMNSFASPSSQIVKKHCWHSFNGWFCEASTSSNPRNETDQDGQKVCRLPWTKSCCWELILENRLEPTKHSNTCHFQGSTVCGAFGGWILGFKTFF